MSVYGIRFNSDPIETSDVAVPRTILARMNELKMQGCEIIIIYILNQVGDDIYHAIKYFGKIKIGKTFSSLYFTNSIPCLFIIRYCYSMCTL